MSLETIKGKLGREEMKKVMGGLHSIIGSGTPECGDGCTSSTQCTGSCNKCMCGECWSC